MAGWDALDTRYRDRPTLRRGSCSRLGSVCELISPARFTRRPLGQLSASHMKPEAFTPTPQTIAPPSASELIARHAVPLPLTSVDEINAELNELEVPSPEENEAPRSCDMEEPPPPFPVLMKDFQSFDVISDEFLSPGSAETPQPEVASFDERGQRRWSSLPTHAHQVHSLDSSPGTSVSVGAPYDRSKSAGVRRSVNELTRHLNSTQQLRHQALSMVLGGNSADEDLKMRMSASTKTVRRGEARQDMSRAHRQTAEGLPALAHLKSP